MKKFSKIISLALTLSIVLGLGSNLFARDSLEKGKNLQPPLMTLTEGSFYALSGQIDNELTDKLVQELYSKPGTEYMIYIDSPGGSVFAGLEVVKAIQNSGKTVTCVANMAISMAFTIFQQCHNRYITADAVLMQHLLSYGVEGDYRKNYTRAEFGLQLAHHIQKLDSEAIDMKLEEFVDLVRDDWWLVGQYAIDRGTADAMVRVTCDEALANKVITKKAETMFFAVEYKVSGCPLIRAPIEEVITQKYERVPLKERQEFDNLLTRLNPLLFIQKLQSGEIRPDVDWTQR